MNKVSIHQDSELLALSEATALLSDLPSDEARLRQSQARQTVRQAGG